MSHYYEMRVYYYEIFPIVMIMDFVFHKNDLCVNHGREGGAIYVIDCSFISNRTVNINSGREVQCIYSRSVGGRMHLSLMTGRAP